MPVIAALRAASSRRFWPLRYIAGSLLVSADSLFFGRHRGCSADPCLPVARFLFWAPLVIPDPSAALFDRRQKRRHRLPHVRGQLQAGAFPDLTAATSA